MARRIFRAHKKSPHKRVFFMGASVHGSLIWWRKKPFLNKPTSAFVDAACLAHNFSYFFEIDLCNKRTKMYPYGNKM
jgi:hypothetical protein